MTEGYILVAIGKNYIDECCNLILTLRKNNDFRPVSLLVRQEEEQYAISKNLFDKIYYFDDKNQIYLDCKTDFERFGVYPKITLDKYLTYDYNIYLDSDILCSYDTSDVWNFFNNNKQPVQALGFIEDPSWHFGKLQYVSKIYGKNVPHTHSGILYMKKNENIYKFFDYCREVFYKHDEYGCSREFRGGIADEILFAISFSNFDYIPHNNLETYIMTYNIPANYDIPTKIQTCKYPILHTSTNFIPFLHMMDKQSGFNYQSILKKILSKNGA